MIQGDCLKLMLAMEADSVDAIVTDPPAGIGFMGKEWDDFRRARNIADASRDSPHGRLSRHAPEYARRPREIFVLWLTDVMRECLRILKPGGHALVWAIPRTSHWTALAIEDAGFEIRDRITHLFASGFPKSLSASKAIDMSIRHGPDPQFDEAKRWQGWGTGLKPAGEDWWLARKPLSETTVASNVLKHGTGALNIDGCRIEGLKGTGVWGTSNATSRPGFNASPAQAEYRSSPHPSGRWPANLVLDEGAAMMLDAQAGTRKSGRLESHHRRRGGGLAGTKTFAIRDRTGEPCDFGGDCGGPSRFYFVAKASRAEREAGLEDMPISAGGVFGGEEMDLSPPEKNRRLPARNVHPTVKPLSLMRWLVRLVTPPGGLVLDPFAGSGSTGIACVLEQFRFLGIEKEAEYVEIARRRIAAAEEQGKLELR